MFCPKALILKTLCVSKQQCIKIKPKRAPKKASKVAAASFRAVKGKADSSCLIEWFV